MRVITDNDTDLDLDIESLLDDPDDIYSHITSYFEWLWVEKIRHKVPRALCGKLLVGSMDEPEAGPNSPRCPRCLALTSGKLTWLPGYGG